MTIWCHFWLIRPCATLKFIPLTQRPSAGVKCATPGVAQVTVRWNRPKVQIFLNSKKFIFSHKFFSYCAVSKEMGRGSKTYMEQNHSSSSYISHKQKSYNHSSSATARPPPYYYHVQQRSRCGESCLYAIWNIACIRRLCWRGSARFSF